MKTRQGFVSNSSSSSFIVAVENKPNMCPFCKRHDTNFLDYIEKVGTPDEYECTKMHSRGAEDTIVWWKNNVCYDEKEGDKEWDEIFDKIRVANSEGKEIGSFSIGYHDESAAAECHSQKCRGNVEVIYSDH